MRVLIALTYYRPYISGLTIYAERVARSLVQRGHVVTILTSRHQASLPQQETLDGVQVHRLNVAARVSKGVVMPGLPFVAWRLLRQADVVNLHLPQLDAPWLAVFARLLGKRLIVTYHCDLLLPSGWINRLANTAVSLANDITARLAHVIVTNTQDYAKHSPFLRRHLNKVHPVYPPAFDDVEQAVSLLQKDAIQPVTLLQPDVEQAVSLLKKDAIQPVTLPQPDVEQAVSLLKKDAVQPVTLPQPDVEQAVSLLQKDAVQPVTLPQSDVEQAVSLLKKDAVQPVTLPQPDVEQAVSLLQKDAVQTVNPPPSASFDESHLPGEHRIGIVARLAAEKGVEYLARALPTILEHYPNTRVLYVGQYQHVLGETAYARRVLPLIEALGDRWIFLGPLPDQDLPAFFRACDVTVLPSLNSTEAFGMVQVESMACGTPVVTSDLPGLRQPVKLSGMGEIVPPADEVALANAILRVLSNPQAYGPGQKAAAFIAATFPQRTAIEYEKIFDSLLKYPTDRNLGQIG